MKARVFFSILVASAWILLAIPALAEPEPDEPGAKALIQQPRNSTEFGDIVPTFWKAGGVGGTTVTTDARNRQDTAAAPNESNVNCSLWPPNCSCACIESCEQQTLQCMAQCGQFDFNCKRACREADDACVCACCGH